MATSRQAAVRFLALIVGTILLVDMGIMLVLRDVLASLPALPASLLDSFLLIVVVLPVLYFLSFRPLLLEMAERSRAQQQSERLLGEVERLARDCQRSAAELHAVLNNMVDGVVVADARGQIFLVNDACVQLLGLTSADEMKGRLSQVPDLLNLRHPGGARLRPDEMALQRALHGQVVAREDQILYNRRAQRDVYMRVNAAPIRDDRGGVAGAVAVVRDVTEVVELDHLKDQFIAVAAHELKTPVTVMKGYAEVLLRTGADAPQPLRRMLEAIDRGADRIDGIVRDLLDISRLHLGHLELAAEPVDLPELLRAVVDRLALTTTRHQIRVARTEPAVVQGDHDRLDQVLVNLIDNAIRYSPQGGDVEVALTVRDREAIISVRDHGIGIPRSKQARIFQPFYRAHTGTPYDYGGMGVGLYISSQIVSRHGGRMWFESEEGKGSTFYVGLPIAHANGQPRQPARG